MAETLKKYRVRTVDGDIKFVMAKNIHDAKSIARIEVGQLPNDVNLKIVKRVLAELQESMEALKNEYDVLKVEGKDLDWDKVNSRIKNIATQMINKSTSFNQLAGSMVRVKNDSEE